MSSLAFPEVASCKTMVASALQPVKHDDEHWLGALVQRGRRSAVCWLAPCRRLAGIVSLARSPHLSHALCKECEGSPVDTSRIESIRRHSSFAAVDNYKVTHQCLWPFCGALDFPPLQVHYRQRRLQLFPLWGSEEQW